jgi:mannan endo-1,4-beta-mannosidase
MTQRRNCGLAGTQRGGQHRQERPDRLRVRARYRPRKLAAITAAGIAAAIIVAFGLYSAGHPEAGHPDKGTPSPGRHGLPTGPGPYIGLYAPDSDAQVQTFATVTGVKPRVLVYYSGWPQPFRVGFAKNAAAEGAVPLVQMNPTKISIAAIAAGQYDSYLSTYAAAVRAYGRPVILSFGHEMNGYWYSWGNRHTLPMTFVTAWQHIVTVFRKSGTRNVTWLWTVNNVHKQGALSVPNPSPWWPGNSYVDWVGIDGYYINPSSEFASVFGPTIVAVRALTHDPILIAETSAAPAAGQPAKIANLFAGVRLYGLLGFVWFDSSDKVDWRLSSPAAIAAFRRSAKAYLGLPS